MKLILHIGQGKTGSTAIQTFLNINRKTLVENYSILYPNFDNPDFAEGNMTHHTSIFENARLTDDYSGISDALHSCRDYCAVKNINTILISNEAFFGNKIWPHYFKDICDTLQLDIEIIVYLRRQDKFIEAAWKQWGHKKRDINNIQEYYQSMIDYLDWFIQLKQWSECFDISNIKVRPYEKVQIGNDVVMDFLKILKIERDDKFKQISKDHDINLGFSQDILEILVACKGLMVNQNDNTVFNFFHETLPASYRKKPLENYNLLSPSERIEIIKKYEESNTMVAKKYLTNNNEELFTEPLPDINEVWKEHDGLSLERVLPVLIKLIMDQNNRIKELEQTQKHFDETLQKVNNTSENHVDLTSLELNHIYTNSKFLNHITDVDLLQKGISFTSTGNDPYFLLPKLTLPPKAKYLKLIISAPELTKAQLFYKTKLFKQYSQLKSIKKKVSKGKSEVFFEIPDENITDRLRLDPGEHAGKYIIHSMSFTT